MTILVIAPHADDETLGMGATIARFAADGRRVVVAVLTGHGEAPHPIWPRENWTRVRDEARRATELLGVSELVFTELPAVLVPDLPVHQVNNVVHDVIARVGPTEVYAPFVNDLHKDHRVITYAVSVATRAYMPLGRSVKRFCLYETPTETHMAIPSAEAGFEPNLWVDVTAHIDRKLAAWDCYASQHQAFASPRSPDALRALATWRGSQIGVAAAEAFQVVRMID